MERRRGLGADEGDGAGLNGLILLLLSARGETAEEGSSPGRSLARSLQKAEAALRSCVRPGLRRLLPPRPRQRRDTDSDTDGDTDGEEEEEAAEGASLVPALEQSFPGLRHALSIREDPHTETFHGHVRPQPGNTSDAFSYHAAHPCVAQRGAALHALLRHRHLLRLVRTYSCRLHAASAFLRRLLALTDPPTAAVPPLHALCRELRAHTRHWSMLRRRLRGNPWLRPLLLHRHEVVAGMRRALLLLALHAVRLTERHAEKRLRVLARDFCTVAPAPLADLFQGLELYNQAVAELEPELRGAGIADGCRAFPVSRVLAVLAAERGRAAAERLGPLLQPQDAGTERECWDDIAVPWLPECGDAEGSGTAEAAGIAAELRALCWEDEELLGLILHVPGAGWTSALGSDALLAQYRPQFWGAAGTALEQRLAPPHAGAAGSAARGLACALAHARTPPECEEELRRLCLRLLCRDALRSWERGFPQALGAGRWAAGSVLRPHPEAALSEAAQGLRRLHPALRCALRCLPGCPPLWGAVLGRAVATLQADSSWVRGSACRFLAAWALPPFLLVTQRDLPVLKAEAERLAALLGGLSPTEPEGAPQPPHTLLLPLTPQLPHTLLPPLAPQLPHTLLPPLTPQPPHTLLPPLAPQPPHTSPSPLAAPLLPHTLPPLPAPQPPHTSPSPLAAPLLPHTLPPLPAPQPPHTSPPPPAAPQPPPVLSPWEHELCQQIRALAAGIGLFSAEVLRLFSSDCRRMAAEIFTQTMPRGRHWRLGLRAELPSSPSAYAAAAAQAVLGQVLQGARVLPRDAQAPTLARVTTAFLEAWMEHILTHRIKFSLQGALQLRRDLEAVRELLSAEGSGLAPEARRDLLSLRALRQMDAAIVCLLQQPSTASAAAHRAWHPLRRCCSDDGAHPQDAGADSLHGLDALEAPAAAPGAEVPPRFRPPVPESYVLGSQQQWLSLRLHRARRWRVPGLPCVGNNAEP